MFCSGYCDFSLPLVCLKRYIKGCFVVGTGSRLEQSLGLSKAEDVNALASEQEFEEIDESIVGSMNEQSDDFVLISDQSISASRSGFIEDSGSVPAKQDPSLDFQEIGVDVPKFEIFDDSSPDRKAASSVVMSGDRIAEYVEHESIKSHSTVQSSPDSQESIAKIALSPDAMHSDIISDITSEPVGNGVGVAVSGLESATVDDSVEQGSNLGATTGDASPTATVVLDAGADIVLGAEHSFLEVSSVPPADLIQKAPIGVEEIHDERIVGEDKGPAIEDGDSHNSNYSTTESMTLSEPLDASSGKDSSIIEDAHITKDNEIADIGVVLKIMQAIEGAVEDALNKYDDRVVLNKYRGIIAEIILLVAEKLSEVTLKGSTESLEQVVQEILNNCVSGSAIEITVGKALEGALMSNELLTPARGVVMKVDNSIGHADFRVAWAGGKVESLQDDRLSKIKSVINTYLEILGEI